MKNIMIMGKMCSGKTSASDYLLKTLEGSKRISLADPIKSLIKGLRGNTPIDVLIQTHVTQYIRLSDKQIEDLRKVLKEVMEVEHESPKPRKRLQYLGENARNRVDRFLWVTLVEEKTNAEPDTVWIIDDIRYPNEFEFFYGAKWLPIFLLTSHEKQIERLIARDGSNYDPSIFNHPSETLMETVRIPVSSIIDSNQHLTHMLTDVKDYVWKNL